jgi:hypothetical protein
VGERNRGRGRGARVSVRGFLPPHQPEGRKKPISSLSFFN